MSCLRGCLLMLWLLGIATTADGATPVRELVTAWVLASDSLRAQTLSKLAQGEVAGAIDYWMLTTGKDAPAWLLAIRTSLDAGKQVAGACQGVAQSVHNAFTQLGGKPEFIQLATGEPQKYPIIVFKLANGRDANVSLSGYHWLVRMEGRAYDAYTGAAGMPWRDYLSRLGSRSGIVEKVVKTLDGAP